MTWPFLYFADEGLSHAELTAARLDGDLVDLGEAFLPADAVETRELRAASLQRLVPPTVVLTRASAAWVHGAVPAPPLRHVVQRLSRVRLQMQQPRLAYRDRLIPRGDMMLIAGVAVTLPVRTLADVARDLHGGDEGARPIIDALVRWQPGLARASLAWLQAAPPMHFKRPALVFLRELAEEEALRTT